MKKLMGLVFAGITVFALSGCGGGSDSDEVNNSYDDVYIVDLEQGYLIEGYNADDDDVTLEYCNDTYYYDRANLEFDGTFSIKGEEIQMFDSDGGSYIIDTVNGLLEVGENYYIFDVSDDITVESITLLTDCP